MKHSLHLATEYTIRENPHILKMSCHFVRHSTYILNVLLSRLRLEEITKPMAVRSNSSFYYLLHAYYENMSF
jgi:hypothetical protein